MSYGHFQLNSLSTVAATITILKRFGEPREGELLINQDEVMIGVYESPEDLYSDMVEQGILEAAACCIEHRIGPVAGCH